MRSEHITSWETRYNGNNNNINNGNGSSDIMVIACLHITSNFGGFLTWKYKHFLQIPSLPEKLFLMGF